MESSAEPTLTQVKLKIANDNFCPSLAILLYVKPEGGMSNCSLPSD